VHVASFVSQPTWQPISENFASLIVSLRDHAAQATIITKIEMVKDLIAFAVEVVLFFSFPCSFCTKRATDHLNGDSLAIYKAKLALKDSNYYCPYAYCCPLLRHSHNYYRDSRGQSGSVDVCRPTETDP
jgi:hypothetical protein